MADPTPYQLRESDRPSWGLGEVVIGLVLSIVVAGVIFGLIAHAMGYTNDQLSRQDVPLSVVALSTALLWIGFIAVPVWAARTKGHGIVADFGARIRWIDVPLGLVAGVVAQFLIVP